MDHFGRFRDDLVELFLGDQVHGSIVSAPGHQQIFLVVVQAVVDDLFQILGDLGTRREVTRPIVTVMLWCFVAYLQKKTLVSE